MPPAAFKIGALSDHTGVNIETIRYYEKIGLLPPPPRAASGHRVYDQGNAKRLMFIRRGRDLGFSLDEVRSLLGLEDKPPSCAEVHALTARHLAGIREKIAGLKRLERTLSKVAKECDDALTPDCPVIDALSEPSDI